MEKEMERVQVQMPLSPLAKEAIKKPKARKPRLKKPKAAKKNALVALAWLNLIQSRRKEKAPLKQGTVIKFSFEFQKWLVDVGGKREHVNELILVDVKFSVEETFVDCSLGYAGNAVGGIHDGKGKVNLGDGDNPHIKKLTHPAKSTSGTFEVNGQTVTQADYLALKAGGKAYVVGAR